MTSNIEAIRAAEAQIPVLQDQLGSLRAEALADDGFIDPEEQGEIDRVEGKIAQLEQIITDRRAAWEQNKEAYEALRKRLTPAITEVSNFDNPDLSRDQQTIEDLIAGVDRAAAAQDFAAALEQLQTVQPRVDNFLSLTSQLAENARLESMTPEELADTSLIQGHAEDIFTEEYMQELINTPFPTDDDPEKQRALSELMNELERPLTGPKREEAIVELAEIVGRPPTEADLDGDYSRFLILREQQKTIGAENGHDPAEDLDETRHPDFQASRGQLLFGKALGDAFGIHEVFASLLSPTGGLVGPGNDFAPGLGMEDAFHWAPDNPVALHGTVHDAAGYLKSYHNEGPGYNYRDNMIENIAIAVIEIFPEDWTEGYEPYTGQLSGIAHWTLEVGEEFAERKMDEALLYLEGELDNARDECAQQISQMISDFEQAKQEMTDAASEFADEMADTIEETEEELLQLATDVGESIAETVEDMGEAATDVAQDVAEELYEGVEAAGAEIADMAEFAQAEAMNTLTALEDAAESAASCAVETLGDMADGAASVGEAAAETLGAVASFIWG